MGKAKNLKKRLASYFRKTGLAPKTAALVARIAQVETTITANETEALLLEQNLIKEWRPPYNILLRDDKSYPYVFLSDGEFPRLGIHRGAKKAKGRYFGPYPSAGAIRESLSLLQKAFSVRQCEDSYYANRTPACNSDSSALALSICAIPSLQIAITSCATKASRYPGKLSLP